MTDAEILILRTKLQAETNPAIVAARDARNDTECANLLNAATASVIWRNNVTRAEIYPRASDATLAGGSATTWNWTTYKQQSVTEQGAWTQMFMGESADFTPASAFCIRPLKSSARSVPALRTRRRTRPSDERSSKITTRMTFSWISEIWMLSRSPS